MNKKKLDTLSLTGMLITLGVVYGDLGTSPLYVMNSIIGNQGSIDQTTPSFIIGTVSLIFWTLMIIATIKYVVITMKADNKHEGGIFALYALVKKHAKSLVWFALIGGAALLADGTLTPAVTVTSATEGLKGKNLFGLQFSNSQFIVLCITTGILLGLFMIQRFGTGFIGKLFGPIMTIWFSFLFASGLMNLLGYPQILKAINPIYALRVLVSPENKAGIFILGSIFLATTGAEALYADMGNVGKKNIYATWPLVYLALTINYLGQGAWIINHEHSAFYVGLKNVNPFYTMLPNYIQPFAIIIAALAAIIASQALITGSYTLVDEAIGLKFLPHFIIKYPGKSMQQMYIATVNWILCAITLFIVWFFRSSQRMESAYGLAITITMLMTTFLLYQFLASKINKLVASLFAIFFASIETVFLLASLVKFIHGGYITLLILLGILATMCFWYFGNIRKTHYETQSEYCSLPKYAKQLTELSKDKEISLYTPNLVYITKTRPKMNIKRSVIYSILNREKRANVYWFVTIHKTNVPFESTYTINMLHTKNIVDVQLYLGYKKVINLSLYLHQIAIHLLKEHVIEPQRPRYSLNKNQRLGDFKFVLINEQPSDVEVNTRIKGFDRWLIRGRLFLQNITASPKRWYGLQFSNVENETSPLFLNNQQDPYLIQSKLMNSPTERHSDYRE